MHFFKKNKLKTVTITYWFLLIYIIAALLWWFIALTNQINAMADMRIAELNKDEINYTEKIEQILSIKKRKTTQYIGEGITFLVIILIGAVFIYRATRKQIKFGQQQQNFMMAVTHELKTPIAITQLNLETIQKRKLEELQQNKLITNTLFEVNRLNNLCNNILWAAQLEAGNYYTKNEEINLSDIVLGCIEEFKTRFSNREINLNFTDNIYINSDVLMMQILVNNLIENAIKYSAEYSIINIDLIKDANKIKLLVKDYGIGISDKEKINIFEKFYRSGNEFTRTTKGTGLGLYLCNKIVKKQNGKIVVLNNHPTGSIFTVTLNAI